jgi:predicted kinase
LSPARLSGERAALIFAPHAKFSLAQRLRSPQGAPLGEVFSFLSSLYFRGKQTYAETFGRAPPNLGAGLVISPAEGLRFLYEPVTLERLRAWSSVDVDARNAKFVGPLVAHAEALERAYGGATRFVLLGSVATDKYVLPLTRVFGDNLLFPSDFVGRGDMSRGGLLLRAAREKRELAYAPVQGAIRHGQRPTRLADLQIPSQSPEVVMLIGLPGAGKTTFFEQHFANTHCLVSKDRMTQRRSNQRQAELIAQALDANTPVVVDNTNVSRAERAEIIIQARARNAELIAYFFDASPTECLARNGLRQGRARVPKVAIFATAKRLEPPRLDEGFDRVYIVRSLPGPQFEVYPLLADGAAASY